VSLFQLIGYALSAMGLALLTGCLFFGGKDYDPDNWF
jgi:hypothetical protein